jgi:mannose-6-phosphate isomerase-like protein (cupin superfamily)
MAQGAYEQEGLMKTAINFREKFSKFSEHWSPRIIARMNDCHFKLVKFRGEFVWHDHKDTDEVFIVFRGGMIVHFQNGAVPVKKGEMIVIPKGVPHKTSAQDECHAILVEAAGTVNTGDAGGNKTAPTDVWI